MRREWRRRSPGRQWSSDGARRRSIARRVQPVRQEIRARAVARPRSRSLELLIAIRPLYFVQVVDRALVSVNEILEEHRHGDWADAVVAAEADSVAYQAELEAKVSQPQRLLRDRGQPCPATRHPQRVGFDQSGPTTQVQVESQSWTDLLSVHEDLTKRRRNMLNEVAKRSGMLRFELLPNGDATGWVGEVRDLGGFRTDAFLEDVPRIAQWLWVDGSDEQRTQRLGLWRNCLTSGGMGPIREHVDIKGNFQQRLEGLDETIRVRIAATLADDVVTMAFLETETVPWRPTGNR